MPDSEANKGWYSGDNSRLFKLFSIFMNLRADYVDSGMIEGITGKRRDPKNDTEQDARNREFAFASLVAAACGLDVYENNDDRRFFREYFLPCFHELNPEPYKKNPYYVNIDFPKGNSGKWTFENRVCKAYEAFVFGDPTVSVVGGKTRVLPQIGYFTEDYPFPAVLENGREWMTLMPNETNTSEDAVNRAHGMVLTFGLGLGYFTYMAAIKPGVESVTVVERSEDVINLFKTFILLQIPQKEKIKIICSDAFEFASREFKDGRFDTVFTDIWHDPSDGVELWLKMKEYEHLMPSADYCYWIEDTLKLYTD